MRDAIPAAHPPRERTEGAAGAVGAARRYLLSLQNDDGHWCAELEGDSILESEYILTLHFLGRSGEERARKAAEYLRRAQLPGGGWANYPGGPAEVSTSVKAYFVLKLMGDDASAPHMVRARNVILSLGGVEACNSFTKIYLAIFGQCGWDRCPAVPPEIVLLGTWFPFHLYRMSAWSRGIVVPLSIIWATKPSCAVPESARLDDLHVAGWRRPPVPRPFREMAWRAFFIAVDAGLRGVEALGLTPLRARALAACESWIAERLEESDGLGAIFPPIINTILAFRCLGYALDDPRLLAQVRELERLELEDGDTLRVQPCFSPVWDTALASVALAASGSAPRDPALRRAARWLLDHEVTREGDWKVSCPAAKPGGWYFEYANEFYPDTDDTGEVLAALATVRFDDPGEESRRIGAIERGVDWLLAMQNTDGGWGAFDKGCDHEVLTFIPFADHNAMIDPSCEDITGRILEAFRLLGRPATDPAVRKAVGFLDRAQHPDGTWYGRWGVNYLYGTFLALRGLAHAGVDLRRPRYQRAVELLRSQQREDGGWGELPHSYEDPSKKVMGPSTASQTAWALLALLALGDRKSSAVARGIHFLLERQRIDGSWYDEAWTGTGFPRVFYLRYHLYATVFPLWALATYAAGGPARLSTGVPGRATEELCERVSG